MMHVTAIIAAAGRGTRFGGDTPKQFLEIGGRSVLERSVRLFLEHHEVTDIVLALPADVASAPPAWIAGAGKPIAIAAGGARRQDSVAIAFDRVPDSAELVVVHDAARPFASPALVSRTIAAASANGAAVAALAASDTVKQAEPSSHVVVATLARDTIYLAQTPQAFRREVLAAAVALGRSGIEATDEAMLAERAGHPVRIVEGERSNVKITTADDIDGGNPAGTAEQGFGRVGIGYDLHRLVQGRALILGGVEIPAPVGAVGHSDADVICHAVTDAILGAASLGDIGGHFPNTDPAWKGASSLDLLSRAVDMVRQAGFSVVSLDVVVVLESPKLGPYRDEMRTKLGRAVGIDVSRVSVKAKTNEGVDAVGRGEAIAAHAVALLGSSSNARTLRT
jgi:2-C-methyl-D-erythritol 4-phosphate cytidylyltransferase/2-C-methyl-D-erythritol 2,4-cyclodiphosphate synthase